MFKRIQFGLFITLIFSATIVSAQSFRFGPKAGMSFASVSESVFNNKIKQPFHSISVFGIWRQQYGLVLQQELSKRVSLQTEILHSYQGEYHTFSTSLGNNDPHEILNFHHTYFLHLPLIVSIKTNGTAARAILNLGFYGAWLMHDSWSTYKLKISPQISADSILPAISQKDAGMLIGVGAEVGQGKNRFLFELRYTRGLYALYSRPEYIPVQTRLVTVSITYLFGFRKALSRSFPANPRYSIH